MTTVRQLFSSAGLTPAGVVRWGLQVPANAAGVYVVASSPNADMQTAAAICPVDMDAIQALLRVRPEATVDGAPATAATLAARLSTMWPNGEPIHYIGLAGTSLQTRVAQYYGTPLGARAPHAGGWPIKTLADLGDLWIHYAPCADPNQAEIDMVDAFVAGIPATVASTLFDPLAPLPFANLMFPAGRRKRHGIAGVKVPKSTSSRSTTRPTRPALAPSPPATYPTGARTRLAGQAQRVTAADLAGGRIRVPRSGKNLFPAERCQLQVWIRDEAVSCRWDPRMGPDAERSGVLSIPRATLARLINGDQHLKINQSPSGLKLN